MKPKVAFQRFIYDRFGTDEYRDNFADYLNKNQSKKTYSGMPHLFESDPDFVVGSGGRVGEYGEIELRKKNKFPARFFILNDFYGHTDKLFKEFHNSLSRLFHKNGCEFAYFEDLDYFINGVYHSEYEDENRTESFLQHSAKVPEYHYKKTFTLCQKNCFDKDTMIGTKHKISRMGCYYVLRYWLSNNSFNKQFNLDCLEQADYTNKSIDIINKELCLIYMAFYLELPGHNHIEISEYVYFFMRLDIFNKFESARKLMGSAIKTYHLNHNEDCRNLFNSRIYPAFFGNNFYYTDGDIKLKQTEKLFTQNLNPAMMFLLTRHTKLIANTILNEELEQKIKTHCDKKYLGRLNGKNILTGNNDGKTYKVKPRNISELYEFTEDIFKELRVDMEDMDDKLPDTSSFLDKQLFLPERIQDIRKILKERRAAFDSFYNTSDLYSMSEIFESFRLKKHFKNRLNIK